MPQHLPVLPLHAFQYTGQGGEQRRVESALGELALVVSPLGESDHGRVAKMPRSSRVYYLSSDAWPAVPVASHSAVSRAVKKLIPAHQPAARAAASAADFLSEHPLGRPGPAEVLEQAFD